MASLFQRGRNWYVQFEDHDRSPTQKQKSTKTSDKGAAREILVEWERLYRTGQADPWTDDMHKALHPDKREPTAWQRCPG